ALDAQSLARTATYDVDTGFGLVADPRRPVFYSMLSFEGEVAVFDYAKREKVATIAVGLGPTHSTITADGRYLYVVNGDANNVVKVDTATNTALLRIAVGVDPSDAVLLAVDAAAWKTAALATLAATVVGALILAARRLRRANAAGGRGRRGPPPPAERSVRSRRNALSDRPRSRHHVLRRRGAAGEAVHAVVSDRGLSGSTAGREGRPEHGLGTP